MNFPAGKSQILQNPPVDRLHIYICTKFEAGPSRKFWHEMCVYHLVSGKRGLYLAKKYRPRPKTNLIGGHISTGRLNNLWAT